MTPVLVVLLTCGWLSLISKNPIISVFFLILTFFFSSIIFIYLDLEFLAFILLIIYVGALTMLFLFVIMMLNLRMIEIYDNFFNYLPVACYINLLFCAGILFYFLGDYTHFDNEINSYGYESYIVPLYVESNLYLIGEVIYGFYNYLLIVASLILLVSMIGSVILTLDPKVDELDVYDEMYINTSNMLMLSRKD
jgi:NADH-quinone oxidoreductase subunit J